MKAFVIVLLLLLGVKTIDALAQVIPFQEDPCGYPDTTSSEYRAAALLNWGYGYDSLLVDLHRWSLSPYVQIDSVGATVRNRAMYMMTIQSSDASSSQRKRVWVHARTHPNEVQGTWVTNELIELLLGESPLAQLLRDSCIFTIMPMYNPDGVELRLPRENANGVDLESNWAANPGEPEVRVLRGVFTQLMGGSNPIRVALNMHSASACLRYFVYHAASGTSQPYATLQQELIGEVRNHFPGGIEPYTYFVSWTGGAPTYYPESWFWYNHREAVLALTYEDKNCITAGGYDSTAFALLRGVADFLHIAGPLAASREGVQPPSEIALLQNFPNPFNPSTNIKYQISNAKHVTLKVFDILGREVTTLVNEVKPVGMYSVQFDGSGLASGVYYYRLEARDFTETKKLTLLK